MIALTGLRMFVIIIKQFMQSLFIFIAFTFSGELLVIAIDSLVKDFDVLAFVDDFEGSELSVVVGDTFSLSLTKTLEEVVVLFHELCPEVRYFVVLSELTEGETGVLEQIVIVDVLTPQYISEAILICCI